MGLIVEPRLRRGVGRSDAVDQEPPREIDASAQHDDANRAAVAAVATADLDLVGLALRGPRNAVDRMLKGARMHA